MNDEIWEQHPEFSNWIDRINYFAQGDGVTEDDVDNMQGEFEEGDYQNLCKRLEYLKYEVQDLYYAIDNAYDYIEKLNKTRKLVSYTFEKINDDDFTISKDGEVLYTIHYDRDGNTVSNYPQFYEFNVYNKKLFNKALRIMFFKNRNKIELEFYEKIEEKS